MAAVFLLGVDVSKGFLSVCLKDPSKGSPLWTNKSVPNTKEFETLTANEPVKPKVLGVKKWRAQHGEWESERGRLLELIRSNLESLGVKHSADGTDMAKAHKEAERRHECLTESAAEEALRLHPDAAAIIQEYDARREREERVRREAEKARERLEKENYRRFRASILELAAKFGEGAPIITNALDGRNYSGFIMGIVVNDGYYYTAQLIDENRVILHNIEKDDMPRISSIVGRNVEIKCLDGRIEAIAEEPERYESSRGWNR